MRLDEVPPGPVYVDTNVWYMYLRSDQRYLAVVRSFLERVIKGEIAALVGVPVLDELFYRLLLARIREQEGQHPLPGPAPECDNGRERGLGSRTGRDILSVRRLHAQGGQGERRECTGHSGVAS